MYIMITNQRPGVYSRVEISGPTGGGRGKAALLLPLEEGGPPAVHLIESVGQATERLAENPLALRCLGLLLGGGAGRVTLITSPDLPGALEALDRQAPVDAIVCGFAGPDELIRLRDFTLAAACNQREAVAFAGIADPRAAIQAARAVCSGRVALTCPAVSPDGGEPHPIYGACALAAAVVSAPTPIQPFAGREFPGLGEASPLREEDVQALLGAGVCVFEGVGAGARLIRALTTDVPDERGGGGRLRLLNTVLIADHVIKGVRGALGQKLGGPGPATIEGIRDQVAVELAGQQDAGILAAFSPPRCRADQDDPGVCLVEISFEVARLLSRIHLTAQIRV